MVKGDKWFKYFEKKVTNKKTPVCQGDKIVEEKILKIPFVNSYLIN